MSKPRLKRASAGWFFGIRYFPEGEFGPWRPPEMLWCGPFPSAVEAFFSAKHLTIVRTPTT